MMDFNDTYFFDREQAWEVAMQQNRVKVTSSHTAPQICYYDGLPLENAPSNLINVPFEKFLGFFSNTSLRLPLDFQGTSEESLKKGKVLLKILEEIKKIRSVMVNCHASVISESKPDFNNDTPWRIVFAVSMYTDVWQYCLKNLAKEFEKKGHDVLVVIEKNNMHHLDNHFMFKSIAEFKPHILIGISYESRAWLHPDIYFVSWWQDITPRLRTADKITWRDRDLIFAQTFTQDELLIKTGAKNVQRQGIGINTDTFRMLPDIERDRKVVFVGSSYINTYHSIPGCQGDDDILKVIDELLASGRLLTMEIAEDLGRKYGIPHALIFEKHASYLMRERTIEWLCQNKDIQVEIYGRYWDTNPIVKPFFRGELPYGEAVAKVYNGAMYAISAVPINITIQRVVEMAACGCIPVVYDCRHIAEEPHWDNECLFFHSREELYACFDKVPAGNPLDIGKADSYESFAEKILSTVREREGTSGI
ncbi:MAG: hypothetical protein AMK71_02970 [Nitrospira bacterium SG8_35_4]|nr:MAG: hypothetical protein AMK71_02970 [Nitrospira bacterium SG8_35_4]